MQQPVIRSLTSNPKALLKTAFWIFVILYGAKYVSRDAFQYYGFDEQVFGRFWEIKWWLIGHVSGALLTIALGPLQFWSAFRNRYTYLHRWFGRAYLTGILIGSIGSLMLAFTSALAIHTTYAIALGTASILWFLAATMAYLSILNGRIQNHKEWMIRSYVITFAFVNFRWLIDMPVIKELGTFVERAPTIVWLSWVIPLFITEMILQWNKK